MSTGSETSDSTILELLREQGPKSVLELAKRTEVTATAVRQRLNRLMGQGLIERTLTRADRGRPSHRYAITDKGLQQTGTNFSDLAQVLWKEIRAIEDPEIRRGLIKRIVGHFASDYAGEIKGHNLQEKMQSLSELMGERNVPFRVENKDSLPVLVASACPYPGLAEADPSVCAMERLLFSEILGEAVSLTSCRLDGASCCTFEAR